MKKGDIVYLNTKNEKHKLTVDHILGEMIVCSDKDGSYKYRKSQLTLPSKQTEKRILAKRMQDLMDNIRKNKQEYTEVSNKYWSL